MGRSILLFALLTVTISCSQQNKIDHRPPENVMPVLGCWFWNDAVFQPEGYKPFIDVVSKHSPYNLLTTSIRAPGVEVTQKSVHARIKAAAQYAKSHGLPMVMDLDVRLARRAFEALYPDELQEMLLLEEVKLSPENSIDIVIKSHDLNDHYTHNTTNVMQRWIDFNGSYSLFPAAVRVGYNPTIILQELPSM